MVAAITPLGRTSAVDYGDCAGIWVMTVFAEPRLGDMLAARGALGEMRRLHPDGFPTLTWVLPEAGVRMEPDARAAASSITREHAASIRGQATLIEGSGFQAATVRAIVAGLDFMARSGTPKKTFAELAPAVGWCIAQVPAGPTREAASGPAIVGALSALRSSISRAPA